MNVFCVILFAVLANVTSQENWLFESKKIEEVFADHSENMRKFFMEQKDNLENVITSSYDKAVQMRESINNYFEEEQKRIVEDINSYVDSVKTSSQKVAWPSLPEDDTGSRLDNPDIDLSVPAIIARNSYHCETHVVISQGYVLNIHRIRSKAIKSDVPLKTVLLQHGLFASSADWILNGPQKALGYVLVDAGYDVWMPNIRGNRYSREHLWLRTDSKPYWNFSWHDVALHDMPAIIDYIKKVKENDTKIIYVGHSMGTTILFAMLTLRPEYNKILTAGIALAPEVFVSNMKSPLKAMAPIISNVAYMEMLYGSYEFIPKNSALGKVSGNCNKDGTDSTLCKNIIFSICGYDEQQFNKTLLPMFLSHLGTGTSWKTAVHFAQEILSQGKFQQFDYGTYYNQELYGTETPPEYDLNKVTLPITLFWAQNDLLSNEKDVRKLYESLPSTTEMYLIPHSEFNHLDYLLATDAPRLLNKKVLESLYKMFADNNSITSKVFLRNPFDALYGTPSGYK